MPAFFDAEHHFDDFFFGGRVVRGADSRELAHVFIKFSLVYIFSRVAVFSLGFKCYTPFFKCWEAGRNWPVIVPRGQAAGGAPTREAPDSLSGETKKRAAGYLNLHTRMLLRCLAAFQVNRPQQTLPARRRSGPLVSLSQ